jgi:superfamily II DNA or RNA helicase
LDGEGAPVTLRPYQQAAVDAAFEGWNCGLRRLLWSMPTGCGKTVAFAAVAERVLREGERVLILAHRTELIEQAKDKLAAYAPWCADRIGIVKAERDRWKAQCVVASVQTLQNSRLHRYAPGTFGLIVVDEAHHGAAPTYRAILDYLDAPRVLGVTATVNRGDGVGLADVFGQIIYAYPLLDAIREGYLCDVRQWAVETTTNLDGVATRAGDFQTAPLAKRVNMPERNALVVKAFLDRAADRQAVAFCVNVAHTKALAEAFRQQDVKAEAVWGEMGDDARADTLARFRRGEVRVLTNCQVLTEGWDEPSVSCILMARPTKSQPLYQQAVGRGLRLDDGKADLLVLDFVDASRKHTLVTVPSLLGLPGKTLCGATLAQRGKQQEAHERGREVCLAYTREVEAPPYYVCDTDPFAPRPKPERRAKRAAQRARHPAPQARRVGAGRSANGFAGLIVGWLARAGKGLFRHG